MALGSWRLVIDAEYLVFILDQLLRLLGLEPFYSLLKSGVEDLAAVAGAPLGIIRVGDVGVWGSGGMVNVLVSGRIATSVGHVLVQSSASLHVARVRGLDMRIQLRRARLAIFDASSGTEGLAMRPLRPAVLVAVELLGVATEVASKGLGGRHDVYDRGLVLGA